MLNEMVMEESNGLTTPWRLESMDEVRELFNPEFAEVLLDYTHDLNRIEDFIFAIDLLSDIMSEKGFPSDRMMDNVDISEFVGRGLNRIGLITDNRSLCGVVVNKAIAGLINEFFEEEYPKVIFDLLEQLRSNFLVFHIEGVKYELIYYPKIGAMQKIDCIRLTRSDKSGLVLHLPFDNKRVQ